MARSDDHHRIPDVKLTAKEKSKKRFKAFMIVCHFLWTHPSEGAFIWVWSNSVVKGTEFLRFGLTIHRI
jgi:hypothetical protein